MADMFILYANGVPIEYRYGDEWEAVRLLVDGGFRTREEAIDAYEMECEAHDKIPL